MFALKQFVLREQWMKTFTVLGDQLPFWIGNWVIYDKDPDAGGVEIGSGLGPEYAREQTAFSAAIGAGITWLLDQEKQQLVKLYFPDYDPDPRD
jgi:hypothetical protein